MAERNAKRAIAQVGALALIAIGCGGATPPEIATDGMEPRVASRIARALDGVRAAPREAATWGRLAMVLHAHRLADQAGSAYAEAARLDPDDPRWPHLHARLLEAGSPEAALVLVERALARGAPPAPALALRARLLDGLDPARAEAAWEALRRADASSVEAAVALGRIRLEGGDAAGARDLLEAAVRARPDAASGWAFLAQARFRLGLPDSARRAAARARSAAEGPSQGRVFDPDPLLLAVEDLRVDARGLEARARRAAAAGDSGTAEAIWRDLLAGRPEDAVLHYNLANALARQGRDDEAERAFRDALERDPQSAPTMANLANLLARTGRDAEAEAIYREAETFAPRHLPTLLGASSLRFQRGDLSGAEALLRRAIEVDPEHAAALQGLGQLLATRGRLAEAGTVFGRALLAIPPGDDSRRAGVHFLLADVERQRGRTAEALRHLARAEELGMAIPRGFREAIESR